MNKVSLAIAVVPLIIVAVGLIGWVTTLRGNLDAVQKDVAELKAVQYDDSALLEQIQELSLASEEGMTKIAWIMEEYGPAIEAIRDRELDTEVNDKISELAKEVGSIGSVLDRARELDEIVNEVKTQIAVIANEQRTINADHQGFAAVLESLGESGLLPSGERRAYGNYGN